MNLNERLTLFVGIGSLVTAIVSAFVAFLAYRQSQDTSELRDAVRHLGAVATQAQAQTTAMREDVRILGAGLHESQEQSRILGRQATSIAVQAEQAKSVAAANATMAQSSLAGLATQQRALFYSASPRLSVSVTSIDLGRITGDAIELALNLKVSLYGQEPVKDYGVYAILVPARSDVHYADDAKRACEGADILGKGMAQELEKDNLVSLGATAKLSTLVSSQYLDERPAPHPVYIGCASYRSPIDNSLHHSAVINPMIVIDAQGKEVTITQGDRVLPAGSLRRFDLAGYSD